MANRLEAWILLDIDHHPEWVEKVAEDRLNTGTCRHCGATFSADLPLLLYFPGQHTPFLFSPANSATLEQSERHARMAQAVARKHFGDRWLAHWLLNGLLGVPRQALKRQLAGGREHLVQEFLAMCVRTYFLRLLGTESKNESQALIEAQSELLAPSADKVIRAMIHEWEATGETKMASRARLFAALLGRCRAIGIPPAIEEQGAGHNPDRSPETGELLSQWFRYLSESEDTPGDAGTGIELARRLLSSIDPAKEPFVYPSVHAQCGCLILASGGDVAAATEHLLEALRSEVFLQRWPRVFASYAVALSEALKPWPPATFTAKHETACRHLESVLPRLQTEPDRTLADACRRKLGALYAARIASRVNGHSPFTHSWWGPTPWAEETPPEPEPVRTRFPADAPADSIGQLLAFLQADSPGAYLFRGQTKAYPYSVPSRFRSGAWKRPPDRGWVKMVNNPPDSPRDVARSQVRSALLHRLGKGIGGIVAQQYGLSSETMDLTESLVVAGFFATREYPTYRPLHGTPNQSLGVIYRFPRTPPPPSFEALEHKLHRVGMQLPAMNRLAWFSHRLAIPALIYAGDCDNLRELEKYFETHGIAEADLMTTRTQVAYSSIWPVAQERMAAVGVTAEQLASSRLARQVGGLLYPIICHRYFIPGTFDLRPGPSARDGIADPPLVAIKDIMAIVDLCACGDCESFYFKHGTEEIQGLSCEYLWPDASDDALLGFVEKVARETAGEYLATVRGDLFDPKVGLIDKGYWL